MKTIAVVQGDAAGIGPELMVKLLSQDHVTGAANILVIGDPRLMQAGSTVSGKDLPAIRYIDDIAALDFTSARIHHLNMCRDGVDEAEFGKASAACGAACVAWLTRAYELAAEGAVDGICFLPFNKEAMYLGGSAHIDELSFARSFFNLQNRPSEFNVANGMWNGRVTSHVPMKDVPDLLTHERVLESIELTDKTLKMAGYDRPRIVVAAYNPHAGDGGLLGDEEIRVIGPAVESAREKQILATGPMPADTLWLKVRDGHYDAVVTMYHDQGQIAIKLMGFEKGVSVLAGLPVPITTPAHGTAFDIAGRNLANVTPTTNAVTMLVNMAERRNAIAGLDLA
ncbi:4-hydroxythreonine-4-phosphate dehydrogenase PdxA [Ensifer sp.]|jgi:4-hydroxythreonine-4-phosphate dehydrogenase|uniref:4-hydroxythreonine-4-phosphate dehydrogenase PdxA n=1 Tax=Ensifer sp. TaxID=1872086 RepID=UPI002E129E40|nr:4-hydroxythreonine-4-phosphate dehydrogenase PdxA [Ensifer sp.]